MYKKVIAFFIVMGLLLGFASVTKAETTQSAEVTAYLAQLQILRQLQEGMTGDDVAVLQSILATKPDIYPEGLVTGYYGALTAKAVRKFQERNGIEAVGRVGRITLPKINELITKDAVTTEDDAFPVAGTGTTTARRICAKVPPGHLISPGFMKHNPETLIVPLCQRLPPGIAAKLGLRNASSTVTGISPLAPVITNVDETNVRGTTAKITWTTNQDATSKVVYGTIDPAGSLYSATSTVTVNQDGLTKTHVVNLSDLSKLTTYYYTVSSTNAGGLTTSSNQYSFETLRK